MVRRPRAGFTLVELMVALTLFALLTAAVLSVAVSMAQGFGEQRQVIETDTAVRAPMDFIVDAIRQASPGVPTGQVFASMGDASCSLATVNVTDGGGPNSGTDMLDLVYASGGVVTTLQSAYGAGSTSLTVVNSAGISPGDTLLITNTNIGVLVFVNPAAGSVVGLPSETVALLGPQASCASTLLSGSASFPAGSLVIRAVKARFSVGPDAQFGSADPVLYMNEYTSAGLPSGNGQPLADGIEDLQIAQGVDTNNDQILETSAPDEWEYDAVTNTGLVGTTRGLRVTLIGRAATQLANGSASNFFRPAAEDHAAGATDAFRRRLLKSTVEIRNIQGSP